MRKFLTVGVILGTLVSTLGPAAQSSVAAQPVVQSGVMGLYAEGSLTHAVFDIDGTGYLWGEGIGRWSTADPYARWGVSPDHLVILLAYGPDARCRIEGNGVVVSEDHDDVLAVCSWITEARTE